MEFKGSNRKYKKMLMIGLPLSFIIFMLAFTLQDGNEFTFLNVLLFAVGGGMAGGAVGVPIFYMLQGEKKVVITGDEIQLIETKKPKTAKLSNIRDVIKQRNGITIKLNKGKLIINNMHGYPLDDIYEYLNKQLANQKNYG
ncbi:hypothetical protein AOX59_07550 [Lentibacillus amyloliquefaciens]|uniref:Uncharacterized protein n=1 Tax=Lentibacillus amyloliquefaciens TaxID=1472767 RepID=A0A0U3NP20_9BACI|nr:hypothetical protein AOX59_07550 [Lentibacillus amyloliquefaciens]